MASPPLSKYEIPFSITEEYSEELINNGKLDVCVVALAEILKRKSEEGEK